MNNPTRAAMKIANASCGRPLRHNLFYALKPPASAIPYIAEIRDACPGLSALVGDDRLHATLLAWVIDGDIPGALLDQARAAASRLKVKPLHFMLNRLVANEHSAVVRPCGRLPHVEAFQQRLAELVRQECGWCSCEARFSPHVTLRYRPTRARSDEIETISWLVRDFVLIDSLVGQGKHVEVGRWPLE